MYTNVCRFSLLVDMVSKAKVEGDDDVESTTASSDKAITNLCDLFQKSTLGRKLKTDLETYHKRTETSIKNSEVANTFKGESFCFYFLR